MTDVTIRFMEMAERAFHERDALRAKVSSLTADLEKSREEAVRGFSMGFAEAEATISRLTAENAAMRKALDRPCHSPGAIVMKELIERLENAEGPDRELDDQVAQVAVWTRRRAIDVWANADPYNPFHVWVRPSAPYYEHQGRKWIDSGYYSFDGSPRYTSSIDAAVTLVPPEHSWKLLHEPEHPGLYRALVRRAASLATVAPAWIVSSRGPALALTIAALKARAALATPTETDAVGGSANG